ncbi:putative PEP-binding protein [Streptomyces sp. NPDC096311]|uniref:putative PEP-binding protein n=1 Tax=Streptomyces sp. NPDC096311 TaxID=3366083 RepID=UPI0037F3F408
MTDRRCFPGQAAAPGIALGLLHRTDRPVARALPIRTDTDPVRQIIDSFDAVAGHLMSLSASLREQGEPDEADIAATPAMAAHPAVLNAIAAAVTAAHRHGGRVSVCGDAAADPLVVPLLVGLGCDTLSVAPAALDDVRARVRRLTLPTCADVADTALGLDTAADVWQLVITQCMPSPP